MSTDPVREIDRVEDAQGRIVIIGVNHGTVTLRTLRTGITGAVTLDPARAEEAGRLYVSACWEAATHLGGVQAQPEAQAAGEPAW